MDVSTNLSPQAQQVLTELAAIAPLDDLEREHIADAVAWIKSGAELCRRAKPATPPKHLVSYFILVDEAHVLLVDHKCAQLWLPTGGHVEPDEHPRSTVLREAEEELSFVPSQPIGPPVLVTCTVTMGLTAGHTDVSLWYPLQCDRRAPLIFDEAEFSAARWFPFSAVPFERSDPHLKRFLQKLAALT
jgi:8-oxo-dGTP pyrophosphatase MutT (NUDIX family)